MSLLLPFTTPSLTGSKEQERKDIIIEEATRKRIKINFVLTGYCGDNQMEDQAVYHEIADATAGSVSSSLFSVSLLSVSLNLCFVRKSKVTRSSQETRIPVNN